MGRGRRQLRTVIGKRIREIRRSRHLTQERLALDVGCAVSTIGLLERGALNATIDLVDEIAGALAIAPVELLLSPMSIPPGRQESGIKQKFDALLQTADRNSIKSLSVIMDSLLNYRRRPENASR